MMTKITDSALKQVVGEIDAPTGELGEKAQTRLDNLTKPLGSLGRLEEFARKLVEIKGTLEPSVGTKRIFTFAGDHGVAEEGVSLFPKEVTQQMIFNFLKGGAGVNVLARHAGSDVVVVDVGVDHDFSADDVVGLIQKKVVMGTRNMTKGPAMTREEAEKCIMVGVELACEHASPDAIFGTGEMGIANTTPSSAIVAAISGLPVTEVTGKGTGIDGDGLMKKVSVIEKALEVNSPDPNDPIDVLAKVGGSEIGAIAGLVLGAAARKVPVVVDGFISTAGALIASRICPESTAYMFSAHKSVERGHIKMLELMGLRPIIDLDLRLGEGTGAALGISLIEAGLKIYSEMATFGEAGVSASEKH